MSAALPLLLADVPQERPAQARTYGTLRLVEDSSGCRPQGRWEIADLEPHVAIRFKHLFPRVPKESAGPFHLPNDLMHAADLEWFTVRYPLAMTAEDRHVLETGRRGWDLEQAELERILLPDYRAPPHRGREARTADPRLPGAGDRGAAPAQESSPRR